ncbi:FecR domain-containing protein [Pseudochelatococcus lubricantis]|uniref:FecR family protein n=1 Tax=Pseudochelatococcus lubricantis TaxID=1538102 RepID=UPI0035EB9C42
MSSQDPTEPTETDVRKEARQWLVRLLDSPTDAQRERFERWRKADAAHDEAFRKVEAVWRATGKPGERLAAREADELAVYLDAMDRLKGQRGTLRRLTALCLALVLLLAGGIWLERPGLFQNMLADFKTGRGERRLVDLPDGSTALLDADSALAEEYRDGERRVRLMRGAAFFDVVSSPVPFVVAASGGEVRVLGTRFDVHLLDDGGLVTLERGRVAVRSGRAADEAVLEAGQQVRFGPAGVGPVTRVDLEEALAWRNGRLVFYRARLAEVVREIERYRRGRIVIATTELAGELVTGSLSLADTDAALNSLQASVGFRMNTVAGRLTVIGP